MTIGVTPDILPAPHRDERQRSSAVFAAEYIRRLILDGTLAPGSKIPQAAIASALGISRIPVREALIALHKEGWVITRHNRGAFVSVITERGARDVADTIGVVLGLAGRRAAQRSTPEFLDACAAAFDDMVKAGDSAEFLAAFLVFEHKVADFGLGDRIASFTRDLRDTHSDRIYDEIVDLREIVTGHCGRILDALTRGDTDTVERAFVECHRDLIDRVVAAYQGSLFRND